VLEVGDNTTMELFLLGILRCEPEEEAPSRLRQAQWWQAISAGVCHRRSLNDGVGIWPVISKVVTAHQQGMMLLSESPPPTVEWPTLAWYKFKGGDG
jgi:hypothetical protein